MLVERLFLDILLFMILALLWTIDLVETIRLVHKKGFAVEANPFAKFLLKHSDGDFILFKMVDFAFIVAMIRFISASYLNMAEILTGVFIFMYLLVVIHNKKVMKHYGCNII